MDRKITFNPHSCKRGFTLIELMFGMVIVAIMMAAIIPMMTQREPGYERKQFTARLNMLMQRAWQSALITNRVHRVFFDFKERKAFVEKETTPSKETKKIAFERIKAPDTEITWPQTFVIQQFIIEGVDEIKGLGADKKAWFYLVPDGLTQQVTLNGIDKSERIEGKPSRFGLVLNPYTAQFKAYDAYQK